MPAREQDLTNHVENGDSALTLPSHTTQTIYLNTKTNNDPNVETNNDISERRHSNIIPLIFLCLVQVHLAKYSHFTVPDD